MTVADQAVVVHDHGSACFGFREELLDGVAHLVETWVARLWHVGRGEDAAFEDFERQRLVVGEGGAGHG